MADLKWAVLAGLLLSACGNGTNTNDAAPDASMDAALQDSATVDTTPPGDAPVPRFTQIALGSLTSAGVRADGTVSAWGLDDLGQLGTQTGLASCTVSMITSPCNATPVRVAGITGATAITAGDGHFCVLNAAGEVTCWGNNDVGELGMGASDEVAHPMPTRVTLRGPARVVAAGGFHTCAVLMDGTIWCWGSNNFGENGTPTTGPMMCTITDPITGPETHPCAPSPVQVPGITNATSVSCGRFHTCALLADHTVQCWGDNDVAQLGRGAADTNPNPMPAAVSLANVQQVSAGGSHVCALQTDGTGKCWGWNDLGTLGLTMAQDMACTNGTDMFRCEYAPTAIPMLTGLVQVASARKHTCVRTMAGTVSCFGINDDGECGPEPSPAVMCVDGSNGPAVCAVSPNAVPGISTAAQIAVGGYHSCAVLVDGTARCWGRNDFGQLGNGSMSAGGVPSMVRMP